MKKYILTFILSGIFFSFISVNATLLYKANEVEFIPNNPEWKVNNVNDAIKDLKTSCTGLNNNINSLETQISNLNDTKDNLNNRIAELESQLIDFTKFKLLWAPLTGSNSQTNTYNGTYKFTENYRYVVLIMFTNSYANTTFTVNNLNEIYKTSISRYHEGVEYHIYKNVTPNASVTFSINNLNNAGIGILGLS